MGAITDSAVVWMPPPVTIALAATTDAGVVHKVPSVASVLVSTYEIAAAAAEALLAEDGTTLLTEAGADLEME